VWSTPRPGGFTPGNALTPIVQEVGWTPSKILDRCQGSLVPMEIRSQDCPACSESLHRLSYPGSGISLTGLKFLSRCSIRVDEIRAWLVVWSNAVETNEIQLSL